MGIRVQRIEDSKLNMTPMIDIVFQLILFFLLNMRFKSLDHRIDAKLPSDRGRRITVDLVDPIPTVKLQLARENDELGAEFARTRVRIDADAPLLLPPVRYTGDAAKDAAREDARRQEWTPVLARLRRLHDAEPTLKGEIRVDGVRGARVPHADVIRALDTFLEAGIRDVVFQGAPAVVPSGRSAR